MTINANEFPCKCYERCKSILIYDRMLAPPPFSEKETRIHHTFKRCGELQEQNGYVISFKEIKKRK